MSDPEINCREDILKYPDMVAKTIGDKEPKDALNNRAAVLRFPSAAFQRYKEVLSNYDTEEFLSVPNQKEE